MKNKLETRSYYWKDKWPTYDLSFVCHAKVGFLSKFIVKYFVIMLLVMDNLTISNIEIYMLRPHRGFSNPIVGVVFYKDSKFKRLQKMCWIVCNPVGPTGLRGFNYIICQPMEALLSNIVINDFENVPDKCKINNKHMSWYHNNVVYRWEWHWKIKPTFQNVHEYMKSAWVWQSKHLL